MPQPLTEHLLQTSPDELKAATQHQFLHSAGRGTLSPSCLTKWLVQDKYYQFGYIQFMGRMISKLDLNDCAFPNTPPKKDSQEGSKEQTSSPDGSSEQNSSGELKWKTLTTLLEALKAIKSEIEFYDHTVEKYDLDLQRATPDEVTDRYCDLFREVSEPECPVLWGLVVLWATEYCYLRAWSHAKDHSDTDQKVDEKGAVGALHHEFIPNWTSDEFKAAVDSLAEVANSWAEELETDQVEKCEKLWKRVLDLEQRFWPDV